MYHYTIDQTQSIHLSNLGELGPVLLLELALQLLLPLPRLVLQQDDSLRACWEVKGKNVGKLCYL